MLHHSSSLKANIKLINMNSEKNIKERFFNTLTIYKVILKIYVIQTPPISNRLFLKHL